MYVVLIFRTQTAREDEEGCETSDESGQNELSGHGYPVFKLLVLVLLDVQMFEGPTSVESGYEALLPTGNGTRSERSDSR